MSDANVFTLAVLGTTLTSIVGAQVFFDQSEQGIRRRVKAGTRQPDENHQTFFPVDPSVGEQEHMMPGTKGETRLISAKLAKRGNGLSVFDPPGNGFPEEAYAVFLAPADFTVVDEDACISQGQAKNGTPIFLLRISASGTVRVRGPVHGEDTEFEIGFNPCAGDLIVNVVS